MPEPAEYATRRISIVAERLRGRVRGPDAEIVDVVTAMLADPWVAHVLSRDAADSSLAVAALATAAGLNRTQSIRRVYVRRRVLRSWFPGRVVAVGSR